MIAKLEPCGRQPRWPGVLTGMSYHIPSLRRNRYKCSLCRRPADTDLSAHRSSWEEPGLHNKQLKYGEIRALGVEIRSKGWGTLGEAGGGAHFK